MPVKSLVELATAAVLRNIKELNSVGDYLPYENIRHILLRIDNAPQLRQIETNSPQIEGETGEIWLRLIERDFPLEFKAKRYKPQNPSQWYRVWQKYKRDHDQALLDSENKLRNALAGLQENKEKTHSLRVVGNKELPRSGRTTKRTGWSRDKPSVFDFHGGKRMKVQRGADVMRKVRREANEIAMIHGRLSRPTIGMPQRPQLAQAPPSMVNDYRRASQPVFRVKVPEPPSVVAEHEENAEFISDSEGNDYDDSEDDRPAPARAAPEPKPRIASKPAMKDQRASAAATSLLKKRPASTPQKTTASPSPKPAVSKPRGLLSNRHKPAVKPQAISSAPKPTTTAPRSTTTPKIQPLSKVPSLPDSPPKTSQYLPRTQTSPPLGPTAGPSSPPSTALPLATSPEQPRKRRAVDIFMRPKKKMRK